MYNRANPPSAFACCFMAFLFIGFLIIFVFINKNHTQAQADSEPDIQPKPIFKNSSAEIYDLTDVNLFTFKGYISLKELSDEVFHPLGYEITKPTLPVPQIQMLKEPTCEETFSEWIRVAKLVQPEVPPIQMPIVHADEYMLNNYAALSWGYMNNNTHYEKKPSNWYRFEDLMKYSKTDLANLEYGIEAESLYNAMSAHRLDGKHGLIIGSMQPWLEIMALQNGAAKLLTVEHYKLEIPKDFQDRLTDIRPMNFAEDWKNYAGTFDFAATFSNIQHMGLGRFGDPLDAIGDLREVLKIRCMLKEGGLLFLGIPIGTDAVQFNVQRIYGPLRISMMTHGYEWLATFSHTSLTPITFTSKVLHKPLFTSQHYTLVLKKI